MPAVANASFQEPRSPECKKAYYIFNAARGTVYELLDLFDRPNGVPRAPGNPSNTDQDLLRSTLVFSGAGLDASLKQLIRDAYTKVVVSDTLVEKKVIDHFSKHLARSDSAAQKSLMRWLFNDVPKVAIVADLIDELTYDSLQSKDQLSKIIEYCGISRQAVITCDDNTLKGAFDARNRIIHQMDVDFTKQAKVGQRTRTPRKRSEMITHAEVLLHLTMNFIAEVDKKISAAN